MYKIEIRLANKNGWHTPAEARRHYGRYSREGTTIHWWNSPSLVRDSDHDNIVNYILGKAARGTGSVNYVVSNNKITLLVNPDNVAWASQGGNPTTVSIECSPHLNDEGYKKVGWLVNELFNPNNGRYKKWSTMYRHSDWWQTVCSGTVDENRVGAEARKWANGEYNPKPPAPPKPKPVPPSTPKNTDFILWKDGGTYVTNKQPTKLHDMTNVAKWSDKIPAVKNFNKGDKIEIVGSFRNIGLNREYYITRHSFDRKLATGFNPVDLDIYVPPRPVPTPPPEPEEPEEPPVEPTDPDPEPPQEIPGWFNRFIQALIEFLKFWDRKDKNE